MATPNALMEMKEVLAMELDTLPRKKTHPRKVAAVNLRQKARCINTYFWTRVTKKRSKGSSVIMAMER